MNGCIWRLGLRIVALAAVVSMAIAGNAAANEPQPLAITSFHMEPTETTIEEVREGQLFGFFNKPYDRPFTQAGGHPWALTTKIVLASEEIESQNKLLLRVPTADTKDIVASLPPGLLGDPMAVPRCSLAQVTSGEGQCPTDTQIGVYAVEWFGGKMEVAPVVNVAPEAGQSAEFALENTVKSISTPLLTGRLVRTDAGYGFSVVSNNIPFVALVRSELTIWGDPSDPSHDAMRGRFCKSDQINGPLACEGGNQRFEYSPQVPFITMPADCSAGPETARIRVDSWEAPGIVGVNGKYSEQWREAASELPGATGCGLLAFRPSVALEPDTLLADEPVGLDFGVSVPLNEKPEAFATPQIRNTSVTFPQGMSVNPSVVDGIKACNATGPEGINITGPESEEIGLNGELQLAPGHCPDASTVGTAEAITPFLPLPVKGHVYLARPGCGGAGQRECTQEDVVDGNLYRLYLELGGTGELAKTGVHFKVPMETRVDPSTGQLTTTVMETPQAPFGELKVHLNGGPRAPIANPPACGPAVTTADFIPWSAPGTTPQGLLVAGTPDATPSSFFDALGCLSPPQFNPGFVAGSVNAQAGQFTAFTLNLSRGDREQYVKSIQLHTPPGLLGVLANVPLCQQPAANAGTCPEASKIGTTRVATGAGSHPFEIEGDVYLTGPYNGAGATCVPGSQGGCAPFGLSVVVRVVAGPFNLGVRVVRARIAVSSRDSTLTVTTDENGPYAIPRIVFGVPVRLQRITVDIDRPTFIFNPTSCAAPQVTASVSGSQDAVATKTSAFEVTGCGSLSFSPKFTVSTSAHTSRKRGASLDAKLSYPRGSMGKAANMAFVKVSLPRQLPSRLTTLQKACPGPIFSLDPGRCPAGAVVGIVRASTPVLPVTLSGPVYFVSHGGERFPSLIVVLQGDGVRVDLTGETFIGRSGITTSTFRALPDVPVSTFELYLPQGTGSALAANGNLCRERSKLKMPIQFVAQNGAQIRKTIKVAVRGCPRAPRKSGRRGK